MYRNNYLVITMKLLTKLLKRKNIEEQENTPVNHIPDTIAYNICMVYAWSSNNALLLRYCSELTKIN